MQEDHGLDVRVLAGLLHPVEQLAERGAADRAERERLIGGQLGQVPRQPEHRDPRLGRGRLRSLLLTLGRSSFRLGGRLIPADRHGWPHGQTRHQTRRHHRQSKRRAPSRRHDAPPGLRTRVDIAGCPTRPDSLTGHAALGETRRRHGESTLPASGDPTTTNVGIPRRTFGSWAKIGKERTKGRGTEPPPTRVPVGAGSVRRSGGIRTKGRGTEPPPTRPRVPVGAGSVRRSGGLRWRFVDRDFRFIVPWIAINEDPPSPAVELGDGGTNGTAFRLGMAQWVSVTCGTGSRVDDLVLTPGCGIERVLILGRPRWSWPHFNADGCVRARRSLASHRHPEPIPMPILLPAKADFVSIDIQAGCYKVIP